MDRPLTRRSVLGIAGASAVGAIAAGCHARPGVGKALAATAAAFGETPGTPSAKMPAAFVGHGSPTLAINLSKGPELTRWTATFPKPKAILVVSAHWEESPATIGATTPQPLIFDFYGFPDEMYALKYDAPCAPALADRVEGLLRAHGKVQRDPERGLDHGAWVPLLWMYPLADVPVLPVSIPTEDPAGLLALGRALSPLRSEGVLILASGNVTHNLRRIDGDAGTPRWASDFDAWVEDVSRRKDLDALVDYRKKSPSPDIAHPTKEHFVPLLLAAGAAADSNGRVSFPITGFEGGSISRRCVQFA